MYPSNLPLSERARAYLNLGVGLLGVEADANGEEVVGVAAARELHAARLVGRVYHRKLQRTKARFVKIEKRGCVIRPKKWTEYSNFPP